MTTEGQPAKECCCTPAECCLYPANPEVSGELPYPFDDLPLTLDITFEGTLYAGATRNDFGFGKLGYVHPDYLSGTESLLAHTNGSGAWSFGDDGGGGSMPCLVGTVDAETFSEDVFSDTYTVTFTNLDFSPDPIEIIVNRDNLCDWLGTSEDFDISTIVHYNSTTFKWEITFESESEKDPPQDSPIGDYADQGSFTNISVS